MLHGFLLSTFTGTDSGLLLVHFLLLVGEYVLKSRYQITYAAARRTAFSLFASVSCQK